MKKHIYGVWKIWYDCDGFKCETLNSMWETEDDANLRAEYLNSFYENNKNYDGNPDDEYVVYAHIIDSYSSITRNNVINSIKEASKSRYKVNIKECGDFWDYTILDFDDEEIESGRTHKVNLDMYDCNTAEDYILRWCM